MRHGFSSLSGTALIGAIIGAAIAVPADAGTSPTLQPAAIAAAKTYVDGIYRAIPSTSFAYRDVRYAPELQRLFALDDKHAAGEVGSLDWVPFCECQDTARNYAFSSQVRANGANGAVVTVVLRNERPQTFRIDLVLTRAGWAVADIHGPTTPSLVAFLRKAVAS